MWTAYQLSGPVWTTYQLSGSLILHGSVFRPVKAWKMVQCLRPCAGVCPPTACFRGLQQGARTQQVQAGSRHGPQQPFPPSPLATRLLIVLVLTTRVRREKQVGGQVPQARAVGPAEPPALGSHESHSGKCRMDTTLQPLHPG